MSNPPASSELLLFWDKVSLCSLGRPQTHGVDQAGFVILLTPLLRSQVCATMPGSQSQLCTVPCSAWWPASILWLHTLLQLSGGNLWTRITTRLYHTTQPNGGLNGWGRFSGEADKRIRKVFSLLSKLAMATNRITNRAMPGVMPNNHEGRDQLLKPGVRYCSSPLTSW